MYLLFDHPLAYVAVACRFHDLVVLESICVPGCEAPEEVAVSEHPGRRGVRLPPPQ